MKLSRKTRTRAGALKRREKDAYKTSQTRARDEG